MRHRVHTFKVGRSSAHRRAMLANMVNTGIASGDLDHLISGGAFMLGASMLASEQIVI